MWVPKTMRERRQFEKWLERYNNTVRAWRESGEYSVTPLETDYSTEMERITSQRQFIERLSQLKRACKKGAGNPIFLHGMVIPKYMRDEVRNIVRQKNKENAAWRASFIEQFDMLTPASYGAVISNRNLEDLREEDYMGSGADFEDLLEIEYPDLPKQAEAYISVWEDMNGDEDIPHIIRYLAEHDPDGFRKLMESPDFEKEIEYIYPEAQGYAYRGSSGFTYKRGSAYKGAHETRMGNAASYWRDQYWDYQNREGYFR